AAVAVRRVLMGGTRPLEPAPVDLVRLPGVDGDVAVLVARLRLPHAHGLVPAVHAGHGVGMDGEDEVLVDAGVGPPDPPGVGIGRVVGSDPGAAAQRPAAPVVFERDGRHQLPLSLLARLPAAHVVAARDDARADALGHPRLDDEMADLALDTDELT